MAWLSSLTSKFSTYSPSPSSPSPPSASTEHIRPMSQSTTELYISLDMNFITPQLIGMSKITPPDSPQGKQGSSKQSRSSGSNNSYSVAKFLSQLPPHSSSTSTPPMALILNLSDSPLCPSTLAILSHQVLEVGWVSPGSKSQTPSIPHVFDICYQLSSFLSLSPSNLALVTCANGKTRSGIILACYLKYLRYVDSSFDGFQTFCQLRCETLSPRLQSKDSIAASIPPSLRQFFRNFDDCVELGGFPNPEPLLLKAVTVTGVPVDDMPVLDIFSAKRLLYTSSETAGAQDGAVEGGEVVGSDASDLQWEDEDGFYRTMLPISGDFTIICRFGGEYTSDTNDPTKVLFRYATSTGFLCSGCYELKKDKVDMMKRYTDSFDDNDFTVTLMFDSLQCDETNGYRYNNMPISSLPSLFIGMDAYRHGWDLLSGTHALVPDAEAHELITRAGYESGAATVALQMCNNDVSRAVDELQGAFVGLTRREGETDDDMEEDAAAAAATEYPRANGPESSKLLDKLASLDLGFSLTPIKTTLSLHPITSSCSSEVIVDSSMPLTPPATIVNDLVVITKPTGDDVHAAMKRVQSSPSLSPSHAPLASASMAEPLSEDYVDARSNHTPVRERKSSSFSRKEEEVKAMLMQLSQAGIGVDDLIKMKREAEGEEGVENDVPDVAVKGMFAKQAPAAPAPTTPRNPAEAMKAMFAKRSGSVAGADADIPPPALPAPPTNPAEAMKAMFAKRSGSVISANSVAFAPEPAASADDAPANPAVAMKAMFARRMTAPAIPAMSDVADVDEDVGDGDSRPKSTPSSSLAADAKGVSLKQDPAFAKYFKMLKMGIPLAAVKQGMVKDGLDPTIMDQNHNKPYTPPPPIKSDERFTKYFKMLKMMIPREAVKQAMVKDGLNPGILDETVDAPLKAGIKVEYEPPKPKSAKAVDSRLPMNADPAFEKFKKYFTMMKMGLPAGAVKNAMVKDGFAVETYIMDLDPKKSHASQAPAGLAEAAKDAVPSKPKARRKKLDWKPIKQTNIDKNSIWGELAAEGGGLELDMHEFDSLFVSRASPESKKKTPKASHTPPKKKASVQVISGKRGMNGGIVLARIRVPYAEIAGAIDCMKEGVLTPEQLANLRECLADRDETRGLQDYLKKNGGSVDEMSECEKFMCTMLEVTNPVNKIGSLILKANFAQRRNDVIETSKFVETACDDVRMSLRLKKLLAIILKVGNQLNHGTDDSNGGDDNNKKHAQAFTLESLLKLNQAKAFDKKTSILHYLVMLVKRNDESLLNFKDDILSVSKAEKIQFSYVNEELGKLNQELKVLKEVAIEEGAKVVKEDKGSRSMSIVDIASQKTVLKTADGTTHYDKAVPMDAEGLGLTPIGRFAIDAKEAWSETKEYTVKVGAKFGGVLAYFGESQQLTPMQFFSTLSTFIRAFDKALDDVTKDEKRKAREERLAAMKKEQEERKMAPKLERNKSGGSNGGAGDGDGDSPKKGKKKISAGRRASTMGAFRASDSSAGAM